MFRNPLSKKAPGPAAIIVGRRNVTISDVQKEGGFIRTADGRSFVIGEAETYGFGKEDVYVVNESAARCVNLRALRGHDDPDGSGTESLPITPEYLDSLIEASDIRAAATAQFGLTWREWLPWAGMGAFVSAILTSIVWAIKTRGTEKAFMAAFQATQALAGNFTGAA